MKATRTSAIATLLNCAGIQRNSSRYLTECDTSTVAAACMPQGSPAFGPRPPATQDCCRSEAPLPCEDPCRSWSMEILDQDQISSGPGSSPAVEDDLAVG